MTAAAQALLAFRVGLASIRERASSSCAIVASIACITGVLLSTLSFSSGIRQGFLAAADPARVIILPSGAFSDEGQGLKKSLAAIAMDAPGIAKGSHDQLLADGETVVLIKSERREQKGFLRLRGIGSAGLVLRPELKIIQGRWFQPGREEVVAGVDAWRVHGIRVGGSVIMRDGRWPVVGLFEGRGVQDSELLTDADTVMASLRRTGLSSVVAKLEKPEMFELFSRWLTSNPALHVTAETQVHYNARVASVQATMFVAIAWAAGIVMSIGAVLGAVNVLYSVVAARTREMAILRALGYEALPVAASVVLETLLLCLAGGLIGALVAWALFDGKQFVSMGTVYRLSVSGTAWGLGLALASALALMGSLPPAIRAGRQPIARALCVV